MNLRMRSRSKVKRLAQLLEQFLDTLFRVVLRDALVRRLQDECRVNAQRSNLLNWMLLTVADHFSALELLRTLQSWEILVFPNSSFPFPNWKSLKTSLLNENFKRNFLLKFLTLSIQCCLYFHANLVNSAYPTSCVAISVSNPTNLLIFWTCETIISSAFYLCISLSLSISVSLGCHRLPLWERMKKKSAPYTASTFLKALFCWQSSQFDFSIVLKRSCHQTSHSFIHSIPYYSSITFQSSIFMTDMRIYIMAAALEIV